MRGARRSPRRRREFEEPRIQTCKVTLAGTQLDTGRSFAYLGSLRSQNSYVNFALAQPESELSPFAAEYRPKAACSTQNKAKRANEIVFLLLVRDQEVDGSNPFAPTTFLPPFHAGSSFDGASLGSFNFASRLHFRPFRSKPAARRGSRVDAEIAVIGALVVKG